MTPWGLRPPWRCSRSSWALRVWLTDSIDLAERSQEPCERSGCLGAEGGSDDGDAGVFEDVLEPGAAVSLVGDEGLSRPVEIVEKFNRGLDEILKRGSDHRRVARGLPPAVIRKKAAGGGLFPVAKYGR